MNEELGHKICQLIIEADPTKLELDYAMKVVNDFYGVYNGHLVTLEEIKAKQMERMQFVIGLVEK